MLFAEHNHRIIKTSPAPEAIPSSARAFSGSLGVFSLSFFLSL